MRFRDRMLIVVACLAAALPCQAQEQRFRVRHDHVWGGCSGELIFGEQQVQFLSSKTKEQRTWKYDRIRQVDLVGPSKLELRSYDSSTRHLGGDQVFRFELPDGPAPESLQLLLQQKMPRPMLSAVPPGESSPAYRIPVRHRHTLGGCQGVIEMNDRSLVFRVSDGPDSRMWHYEDIQAIASLSPFELRINVLEGPNRSNQYLFELKQRLDPDAYEFLWWRVNPGISLRKPPAP